MIEATLRPGFDRLAARLAEQAKTNAEASAETRLRETRQDASRWRKARLLWPLFTKG